MIGSILLWLWVPIRFNLITNWWRWVGSRYYANNFVPVNCGIYLNFLVPTLFTWAQIISDWLHPGIEFAIKIMKILMFVMCFSVVDSCVYFVRHDFLLLFLLHYVHVLYLLVIKYHVSNFIFYVIFSFIFSLSFSLFVLLFTFFTFLPTVPALLNNFLF